MSKSIYITTECVDKKIVSIWINDQQFYLKEPVSADLTSEVTNAVLSFAKFFNLTDMIYGKTVTLPTGDFIQLYNSLNDIQRNMIDLVYQNNGLDRGMLIDLLNTVNPTRNITSTNLAAHLAGMNRKIHQLHADPILITEKNRYLPAEAYKEVVKQMIAARQEMG